MVRAIGLPPARAMMMPPPVTVTKVEKKTVPLYLNYVGNTATVKDVDIRARVEGFLLKRNFKEGDDVRKGRLMYVIDEKPFRAALDEAAGQLKKDRAALAYAAEQVRRYKDLAKKDYVSKEDFDSLVTQKEEARAAVAVDQAAVEQARINLGYCRMYAPFNGRVGRTYVHVGNLVGAGESTKLATLVQLDPFYVYFSPSDEDSNKIITQMSKGKIPIKINLTDGSEFQYGGTVEFINNKVDTATSTVTMRATIPNPEKTMLPGVYVNVQLHLKDMEGALVVPEEAIAEDQGGQYVMLVGSGNKTKKQSIKTGEQVDHMQVVTDGLEEGDVVITAGLQMVKSGMPVTPEFAKKKQVHKTDTVRGVVHKALFN